MKKRIKKILVLTLLFLISLTTIHHAHAQGAIDIYQDVSFTISYQKEDQVIADAKFDFYKIADVDEYGHLTLCEDFADYPISMDNLDDNEWNSLAFTLKGYVQRDAIEPVVSERTDMDGQLTLSLKPGLYLIVGNRHTIGEYTYSASPYIVFLPESDQETNSWTYTVTSFPKSSADRNPLDDPTDRTITRKAIKIWEDNGNTENRPQYITVELLCDGKYYDSVKLSKANNWRWVWEDLYYDHDWQLVEEKCEGYTTLIDQEGITFVVTNTYIDPVPEPVDPSLPHTGQLWWPAMLMCVSGLLLILIGLILRKGRSHD